jgi:hypothetical protein
MLRTRPLLQHRQFQYAPFCEQNIPLRNAEDDPPIPDPEPGPVPVPPLSGPPIQLPDEIRRSSIYGVSEDYYLFPCPCFLFVRSKSYPKRALMQPCVTRTTANAKILLAGTFT